MLISLGNLGKPFWLGKHIFTNRKDQKQTYTKNRIQELHDKKSVNTKSTIMGNSPIKITKL